MALLSCSYAVSAEETRAQNKHYNHITILTSCQWQRLDRPLGKYRQQCPTPDRRPSSLVIISYSIKFLRGAIFSGAQTGWTPTSTQTSTCADGNRTHQSSPIDTWRASSDSKEYDRPTLKYMKGRPRLKRVRSPHP